MITVRYPNGQAITYNQAHFVQCRVEGIRLLTKPKEEGGTTVAIIQPGAGVTIDLVSPGRIENPVIDLTVEKAVELLSENIRTAKNVFHVAALKNALRDFDARRCAWKPEDSK